MHEVSHVDRVWATHHDPTGQHHFVAMADLLQQLICPCPKAPHLEQVAAVWPCMHGLPAHALRHQFRCYPVGKNIDGEALSRQVAA